MAPASGASTSTVSSRAEGKPRLRARSSRWLSDPSCRLQAWAQPRLAFPSLDVTPWGLVCTCTRGHSIPGLWPGAQMPTGSPPEAWQ